MPKPAKIEMSCTCGKLRGHGLNISPATGRHLVCMCKDCQAYAQFLGRAEDILDENGGSEIFQIAPSQIRLETGLEHLQVVRLSPKGTLRWYAGCCNSPIANTTATPALPFAGVFCDFIKPRDPMTLKAALGPVKQRYFARDGYGKIPDGTQHKISTVSIAQTLVWLAVNKLRGKAKPSPFFKDDKNPVVTPTILSKEERERFTTA